MIQSKKNNNGQQLANQKLVNVHSSDNIKEYLNIIRASLLPIILIFLASILITTIYVINAVDIYRTITTLKISKPKGSVISSALMPDFQDFQTDRFISNEIEILKSYSIRERVALAVQDTFKANPDKSKYYHILNKNPDIPGELVSIPSFVKSLSSSSVVSINQKRGLDIAEIEVQSPSGYEAKLIANVYAGAYQNYSLDYSKRELTAIRQFLGIEKDKRIKDLTNSEAAIQDYQQKGGIIFLDDQAKKLVDEISTFTAQKNLAEVEYLSKQKAYDEIRSELEKVDKSILDYVDGQVTGQMLDELQKKVSELEVQKEIELSIANEQKLKDKVADKFDRMIYPLKKNLNEKVKIVKAGIMANTPAERSQITQKLFEINIETQTNKARFNSISKLLGKYESIFEKLPAQSIELARLERDRKSNEKLFLVLEEKYQEAYVNERAQLGNVNIVDTALLPVLPAKPNRQLIVMIGALLGLVLGIGFAFLRNYLDRTIKNPEEIEGKGVSVLAWIPSIEELKELGSSQIEFIVANKPNATASESFKALRTRVLYSKLESDLKSILVTSSVPSEGKTTVALNLAGTFAQADKKVLLVDCDLRKPRVHSIFETERFPGLSDYLFANVEYNDIIRKTKLETLDFITSGTIPPNPSELLGSKQMNDFMELIKGKYDIVILDSPPFISVTDAEILSRLSDGTILVVQANKTPSDAFYRTAERLINSDPHKFLGSVLNNFSIKTAYGYYYNYYYYYSKPEGKDKQKIKSAIKVK